MKKVAAGVLQLRERETQRVPVTGIADTGSDCSIMSGYLFKTIVGIAELKEEDFKPASKYVGFQLPYTLKFSRYVYFTVVSFLRIFAL